MILLLFLCFLVGYIISIKIGSIFVVPVTSLIFYGIVESSWFRRKELDGLFYMTFMIAVLCGEIIGLVIYWSKYPYQFSSLFQTTLKFLLP